MKTISSGFLFSERIKNGIHSPKGIPAKSPKGISTGGNGKKPYTLLKSVWGAVPAPENFYISFLLSNVGYILFGSLLLLKDDIDPTTGRRMINSSRYLRGWLMFLVGIISVVFHSNQVAHGHEDTRTHIFHILDVSVAIIIMIIALILNGRRNIPVHVWVVAIISVLMFLESDHYGLVHSAWHLASSYVLFELLNY